MIGAWYNIGMKPKFQIGDFLVHVKDPFQEKHEVVEMVENPMNDGSGRILIKAENTGEVMPLIISQHGLAGWKKV